MTKSELLAQADPQPVAVVLDSQQVRGVMWGVDWKSPVAAGTKLYAHPDPRIASLEVLCRDLEVRLRDALARSAMPGSATTEGT